MAEAPGTGGYDSSGANGVRIPLRTAHQ